MGIRRPWLVLLVLLTPAGARAGHHKFDTFVAPSYLVGKGSTIELGGWHVSGAATLAEEHAWLSLVGDLSVHFVGLDDRTQRGVTQFSFMAGPRFTVKNSHPLRMLFGHVMLLGAVHRSLGSQLGGTSAGAVAIGVGYEFAPGEKKGDETWGTRLQIDYVRPVSSDLRHGWRFSLGATYRFQFEHEEVARRP
jgi:hypothetical protein